jgi:hypothetical protein
MNLQEAMLASKLNSAVSYSGAESLVVDGRSAPDYWTIRSGRLANQHYGSLEALIEEEASSHRWRVWQPYTF